MTEPVTHLAVRAIPLDGGNTNDQIQPATIYLVRVDQTWLTRSGWYLGTFSKLPYGWSFNGVYSAGLQLNGIQAVYAIDLAPLGGPAPVHELASIAQALRSLTLEDEEG